MSKTHESVLENEQITRNDIQSTMVVATSVSIQGAFGEVVIPAKTTDVLEWLRKKYKQPAMQFQGKILHEETAYAVFATPTEDEDEHTSTHILPTPFQEDSFQ